MKLQEQEVASLNLTQYQQKLFSTPFRVMNKEQKLEAMELGDKVFTYQMLIKDQVRKAEKVIPYWEKPEEVIPLPKKFY